MGHTKHTLISDFENQKEGDSVLIADCKIEYFIECGYIKGKKKKTKIKVADKIEEVLKENNNIIKK